MSRVRCSFEKLVRTADLEFHILEWAEALELGFVHAFLRAVGENPPRSKLCADFA